MVSVELMTVEEFILQIARQVQLPFHNLLQFNRIGENILETQLEDLTYRIIFNEEMHEFNVVKIQDEISQTLGLVEIMPNIKVYNNDSAIELGKLILQDVKTNIYPKYYREGQFGFKVSSIEWEQQKNSEYMEIDIQNFTEKGVFFCTTIYEFDLDSKVGQLCLILLALNNYPKHCDLCSIRTTNSTHPNLTIKQNDYEGLVNELKQKITTQIKEETYALNMLQNALTNLD